MRPGLFIGLFIVVASLVAVSGCHATASNGSRDASRADGAARDGGSRDGGSSDGAMHFDAGREITGSDAGTVDGAIRVDGSFGDAVASFDAERASDANDLADAAVNDDVTVFDASSAFDAASLDAGHDASNTGPVDAGADTASAPSDGATTCTPITGSSFTCGIGGPCSSTATQYCAFGSIPNVCSPMPIECECAETHDCACLLAHATSPCVGGTLGCTPMAGGALWLSVSGCHP